MKRTYEEYMNSKYIIAIDDLKRAVRDNGADGQNVLNILAKNDLNQFELSSSNVSEISKESQPLQWGVMNDISPRDIFDLLTVIRDQNDKIISLLEQKTIDKSLPESNNDTLEEEKDKNTNNTSSDIFVTTTTTTNDNKTTKVKQNKPSGPSGPSGTTIPYWTSKRWMIGMSQPPNNITTTKNSDTITTTNIDLESLVPNDSKVNN